MAYYKKNPFKLFIQDIFRATQSEQNKYVYEIFGRSFKNVMLHGVVTTSIYNATGDTIYFQLSDPTASVQVYCNKEKSNHKLPNNCIKDLERWYENSDTVEDRKVSTMSFMLDRIKEKDKHRLMLKKGDFVRVVGDIFVDSLKNIRMIAAYEHYITNIESDLIWMEDMQYLYNNYYNKT